MMRRTIYATCPHCANTSLDVRWDPTTPLTTITEADLRPWCACPITVAEAQEAVRAAVEEPR